MDRPKNYTAQIVEYLRNNMKKGYTKDSLKWALVNQGHSKLEIDRAFQRVESELAAEAPILKTKPEIKYEVITSDDPGPQDPEKKESFLKRWFG